MHGTSRLERPGRVWVLRLVVGTILGVALIAIVVKLVGEAHETRGALTTLRHAQRGLVAAAAIAEALSYVALALVLALLAPGLRRATSAGVTLAAFGAGSLLPGQPAGGIALTVRELTRRGLPVRRATAVALTLLVGVPATSMALLAGPTLVLSASWGPLPGGWRALVAVLGVLALVLGAAVLAGILAPASLQACRARLPAWLVDPGRRGHRGRLLALGAAYWIADASCLWLVARALGVGLPLSTLPIAYVTGAVVIAIPILPGGLGGVEAAVPLVLAAGPVRFGQAALAVLAWRALSFWLPALLGLGCLAALTRVSPEVLIATESDPPHPSRVDAPAALR